MSETPRPEPSLDDRLSNIEATNNRIEARLADFDKAIVAIKTKLARNTSYQK